jgi:outer membrane protein TolC
VARRTWLALVGAGAFAGCRHVAPAPMDPPARAAAFEARTLDAEDLHAFLATALGSDLPWPMRRWDVSALTAAALWFQPDFAVVRANAAGATAAIVTAGARPNPTLALIPEYVTNPGGMTPWGPTVQFDWPIETGGKRARRIEHARAAAASAALAARGAAWAVQHQIATALVDVVTAQRRVASLSHEVDGDRTLAALVDARVAAGTVAAGIAASFHLARLDGERQLGEAEVQERTARAALAAAIGVPARALDAVELATPIADPELATATRDTVMRRALFERPDVLAALADYAAAEATLRLQLARQWPDLHIGPGYQFDQGLNKWSVGLSLELPLLDRNDGPIGEALAARTASAAAFDATQAHVVGDVERALAQRDGARVQAARLAATAAERRAIWERLRMAARLGTADRVDELGAELDSLRAARASDEAELAGVQASLDLEAAVQPAALAPPLSALAAGGGTP